VRSECPDNRRKNKLELTETGRSTYPTMQAAASRAIDRYLGSFDPAELYQLESMLHRMKPRN
ncbi:MAG: hypothetical protein JO370_12865, partial [Paucibacter sp.]|nr:hypothetical protein [Roseateles sp.]